MHVIWQKSYMHVIDKYAHVGVGWAIALENLLRRPCGTAPNSAEQRGTQIAEQKG